MIEHRISAPTTVAPDVAPAVAPGQEAQQTAPRQAIAAASALAPHGVERLLTVRALLQSRPRLAPALRAAGYEVLAIARWDGLLEVIEHECVAATLVDLDAANQATHASPGAEPLDAVREAPGGRQALSGDRMVSLLARRARDKGFALVVQTALDYAEIEELVHQGVHALIHPQLTDDAVAASIKRVMQQRSPRARPAPSSPTPRTDTPRETLEDAAPWPVAEWPGAHHPPRNTPHPPAFG